MASAIKSRNLATPLSSGLTKFGMFLLFLVVWQTLAVLLQQPDFPTFTQTLSALHFHTFHSDLLKNVTITVTRVVISFILAMLENMSQ